MKEFTYSEVRQQLAALLERAHREGAVRIYRGTVLFDGQHDHTGPDMSIQDRLRRWILLGSLPEELPVSDIHPRFSLENGAFRITAPDAVEYLRMSAGLCDLDILVEASCRDAYCAVGRGRDPITGMWHQCAWVFSISEGKVVRLVTTTSQGLPQHPYDGTLPLRSVES